MKVSRLSPPELDYWVARADLGAPNQAVFDSEKYQKWWKERLLGYSPSTDWSQGGPIIESEGISLEKIHEGRWSANGHHGVGPTPLIAAMRAYIASKFGDAEV